MFAVFIGKKYFRFERPDGVSLRETIDHCLDADQRCCLLSSDIILHLHFYAFPMEIVVDIPYIYVNIVH